MRVSTILTIALVTVSGCKTLGTIEVDDTEVLDTDDTDVGNPSVDADDDGFSAADDCDDDDAGVHPDATEVPYDGVDNDCLDGDLVDVDGDGFDGADVGGVDCDDTDDAVHPDAAEVPGDGVDNDCNPDSDLQSGFETTAIDWPIPDEYGPEAFDFFSDFDNCASETPSFSVVDLDGDGLRDIVVTEDPCDDARDIGISKWLLYKNTGSSHDSTAIDWPIPADYGPEAIDLTASFNDCGSDTPAFSLLDLDGDGLQDLVVTELACDDPADTVGVTEWLLYRNNGAGFETTADSWPIPDEYGPEAIDRLSSNNDCPAQTPSFVTTDLDGDALPDIVVMEDACDDARDVGVSKWLLYKNNGAGFDITPVDWPVPATYGPEAMDQYGSPNNCAFDTPAFMTRDLNGDGLVDLAITEAPCDDAGDTLGIDMWSVHLSDGSGFAVTPIDWSIPADYGPEALDVGASANDCAGSTPAFSTRDADGDGLPDLLVTEAPCDGQGDNIGVDHWLLYAGTGSSFALTGYDWALPTDYGPEALDVLASGRDCGSETPAFQTTDLDGDGLLDLVVTEDPCDATDIGDVRWSVYRGHRDL